VATKIHHVLSMEFRAGENCLIDQHGYLKIIDFGVAERVPSLAKATFRTLNLAA
jgi:serine/threonine protein kinase